MTNPEMDRAPIPPRRDSRSGLAQGGLGGPEDQLLQDGQEEVFARAEVESGRIEHHADADSPPSPSEAKPSSPTAKPGDQDG